MAEVPGAVVGIGTVLTPADLDRAVAIGARFALSPGATPALLDAASNAPIPFLPGIATASELMEATSRGFSTVKFFPATAGGGIPALRALAGPFPSARFCPTGGISAANAAEWLALPNVTAVGGSWLTPAADITAGRWGLDRSPRPARRPALGSSGLDLGTAEAGFLDRILHEWRWRFRSRLWHQLHLHGGQRHIVGVAILPARNGADDAEAGKLAPCATLEPLCRRAHEPHAESEQRQLQAAAATEGACFEPWGCASPHP